MDIKQTNWSFSGSLLHFLVSKFCLLWAIRVFHSPQVKEILFLKVYFFSTIQIYSWIAKPKWKKVDLTSNILGQLPSSIESPGQAFPPPVGWGFVHDLVLTFLFPPHKPEPQPLHWLQGDQFPSTIIKFIQNNEKKKSEVKYATRSREMHDNFHTNNIHDVGFFRLEWKWNTSLTMFLGSEILLKIVFVFPYPTVTVENKWRSISPIFHSDNDLKSKPKTKQCWIKKWPPSNYFVNNLWIWYIIFSQYCKVNNHVIQLY